MPARVLLVDDDPDILDSTEYLIANEGYDVDVARHGLEALDRVAAHRPDVIVLDLMMPVMDGWQFAEELHKGTAADVPIIVLSACHNLAAKAQQLGAQAYVAKPFEVRDLLLRIASVVGAAPAV